MRGVLLLLIAPLAWAAQPRVAVMPFKDLSGQKPSVGEAIAETVASDLRELPGMRVVERANVNRVLAELDLGARRADLDAPASVKVGRLLSATLMVVGSYQETGGQVRINARFVDVASGEVAGSAKVDGAAADFFKLQDRITAELLKSASFPPPKVTPRPRPKLKSLRAIELYGDSVVEPDDAKKKQILAKVLDEEPTLSYAVRDLDALDKRLAQYAAAHLSAEDKSVRDLKDRLAKETVGDQRGLLTGQLFSALFASRRYHGMIVEARAITAHPGAVPTNTMIIPEAQTAGFYLVMGAFFLKDDDLVLREAERYMKNYPGTIYYSGVESYLQQSLERKRNFETGKKQMAEWLAKYGAEYQGDYCYLADVYRGFHQNEDSRRLMRTCLLGKPRSRGQVLKDLVYMDIECGDWKAVREDMQTLEAEHLPDFQHFQFWWKTYIPADG